MAKQQLTYAQIQQQIEQLQAQAKALRTAEVSEVVNKIKEAIRVYGLTAADLGLQGGAKIAKPARVRTHGVDAKYRDSEGRTWGGRGPRPKWLREAIEQGHSLEEFAV